MKRLGCVSDREKPPLPFTSRDWQTSGGIAGVLDRTTRAPRLISQETDLCAGVESGNMLWILVESWTSVTAGPEQKPLVLRRVMVALVSVGLFWCDWVLRWVQILSHSWLRMGCALLDYVSMRTDSIDDNMLTHSQFWELLLHAGTGSSHKLTVLFSVLAWQDRQRYLALNLVHILAKNCLFRIRYSVRGHVSDI